MLTSKAAIVQSQHSSARRRVAIYEGLRQRSSLSVFKAWLQSSWRVKVDVRREEHTRQIPKSKVFIARVVNRDEQDGTRD